MEIKPGEHGRVTLRGYLAGMPDVGRLQEEAVRIMLQEDGDNREQVLFRGIIQSVHTFVENGVCLCPLLYGCPARHSVRPLPSGSP